MVALTAPLAAGLGVADVLGVGLIDGQGEADELALAVDVALGDVDAVGEAVGKVFALGVGDGVAVAVTAMQVACGWSSVSLAPAAVVGPPRNRSAAGTTSKPRMAVTTKASAPHSRSQKARDELRIRARRPDQAGVYFAC